MIDDLLKEILKDEELASKYNLSKEVISRAKLSGPYENKVIEYLAVILKSKMADMHGDVTVYNQVRNLIK
jgi:aromatic ring-opening dioxygenase LigB subunit